MAKNNLTNFQIYGLILLIFYVLVKSILHFVILINIFNLNKIQMNNLYNNDLIISDIGNAIFILLSLYLLFMKNVISYTLFFTCILLLFKGLFHFITNYKIYKYFKFDKKTQEKIEKFHYRFAIVSDLFIGIISLFLLSHIF